MTELLLDPQAWSGFVVLTALELVLGIDKRALRPVELHERYTRDDQ